MRAAERTILTLLVLPAILSGSAAGAASIVIVNNDGVGEGFNDLSPRVPVTGNSGVTLGQQRLNVFNAAAAVWGQALKSGVQVRIGAEFNSLFCNPTSAVLGSAGPENAFRDFSGRPVAGTWYVSADANSRHGSDLDPGVDDIGAQFNSELDDGSAGCLGGNTWWYGIGAPPPAGKIDLFTTVLHEIAHGLGFLSLHDSATGNFAMGFPDAYSRLLKDQPSGKLWTAMTSGERLASQISTGNLVWTGARANSTVPGFNTGVNASQMRMFAPNPFQGGSSVSHWDTAVSPNELQEPVLTTTAEDYATYRLLEDVGWLMNLIFKDGFESQDRDFWTSDTP